MESTGKFIVLEGIEGCGKGTQTKFLSDFLSSRCIAKKYPEYGKPIGDLINDWLHKKYEFNAESQALLYFADFMKDKEEMEKNLKDGKMVVADRYFSSTMIYQSLNGFPLERLLKLAELFDLRKPDLIIYIRISPETSFARKMAQKGIASMDRHEEDKKFLNALYEKHEELSQDNVFCEWATVDGEQSPEEVSKQILELLNKRFGI